MEGMKTENRVSEKAVKLAVLTEALATFAVLGILAVLMYVDHVYGWADWIGWMLWSILLFVFLSLPVSIYHTRLLYRNWEYGWNEEFLHMRKGGLRQKLCQIPMSKIVYVQMDQGLLQKKDDLWTVKVRTLTSVHDIPYLSRAHAEELKEKAARFGSVKEEGDY